MPLKSSQPLLITLTRLPSPCTCTTGLSYHNAAMPGELAPCPGRTMVVSPLVKAHKTPL